MQIAVVFASSSVSDKEEQLVRAMAALPFVTGVTVVAIDSQSGIVAALQKLRALVEAKIVGSSLAQRDIKSLVGEKISAGSIQNGAFTFDVATVRHIVNLSGLPLPARVKKSAQVLELWLDGARAISLGTLRAVGKPAHDLVVTACHGDEIVRVVERSVLTLTPATPAGDRRNAASRSISLILRALQKPSLASGEVWNATWSQPSAMSAALGASVSTVSAIANAIVRRITRPIARRDAWEIKYRTNVEKFVANTNGFSTTGFKTYRRDYGRFVADPVAFQHNAIDALFFEEYPHDTRRGFIACAVLNDNGTLGPAKPVLARPYHLSYPFVFQSGHDIFMLPESSANKTVDLYRCTTFPFEWQFEKTLLNNISITDATVHFDGQRWWMFATVGENGAYAWDELHLFMSDSPDGDWTPHPNNPVKCDARTARPAGQLFVKNGRLLRPTQDCSRRYGGGVILCEVQLLTPTEFVEREVERIAPEQFVDAEGLHTLSATNRLEVIDVRPKLRWRWEKDF